MPIWQIFRVSQDKLGHKICWPELSNRLEAVYLPNDLDNPIAGKSVTIPIQTAYIMPIDDKASADIVAAWLNSLPVRAYVASYAERARGAYFRHFSWVLGLLPVPTDIQDILQKKDVTSGPTKDLQRLSQELHANPLRADRQALEKQINTIVAKLYQLDNDEDVPALEAYSDFIKGGGSLGVSEPTADESGEKSEEA
jgi:hypothetical protein